MVFCAVYDDEPLSAMITEIAGRHFTHLARTYKQDARFIEFGK